MYNKTKFLPSGDSSIVMEFGNSISPKINAKIRNMVDSIDKASLKGIVEIIPTYRSIQIIYNPMEITYDSLLENLIKLENTLDTAKLAKTRIIEIPTIYGGEYGPDIEFVAQHNKITIEEVINIHTSTDYLLYMLGFTPGFGYLGGMNPKIETPRLKVPRTKIPAGSVGIADKQTGIYPIDSPGGWQLIGRTPIKLYDPFENPPVLLNAGDYIRFVPIDEDEYFNILDLVNKKKYKVNILNVEGDKDHE
jgi:inhibitor of KinA